MMKNQDYSIRFRLAAFVMLVAFTAVSCYIPTLDDTAPQSRPGPIPYSGPVEIYTGSATPISFYLADDYQPAEEDTGITAFALDGSDELKDFMSTAEEKETGGVVRFFDNGSGMAVSMYFSGGSAFPNGFMLDQGEDGMVRGSFSPYNEDSQSFSLTLHSEGEDPYTFDGLVMNKHILTIYEDDSSLTPGQNARVRNYVTALSVWTAIMHQFSEMMAEAETAPDGISASSSLFAGIQYSFWGDVGSFFSNVGKGIVKAVKNICTIGATIAAAAFFAFKITAAVLVSVGAAIGTAIAAPVVVAIAVVVAVAVTVVNLYNLGKADEEYQNGNDEENTPPPPPHPEAPRFRIYYLDESGQEQDIPVMRKGDSPAISDEFYIKPHGTGFAADTSNVKFYFEVTAYQEEVDDPGLFFNYSPSDDPHYK
jgi:hypothetical protein